MNTRPSHEFRASIACGAVATLTLIGGCQRESAPARRDTQPAAGASEQRPQLPPRSMKSVADYTADDLKDYLNGRNGATENDEKPDFSRSSFDRERDSDPPREKLTIELQAVTGNHSISTSDMQNLPVGYARVLARFRNKGGKTEHGLKLRSGKDTYWFVQRDSDGLHSYFVNEDGTRYRANFTVCDSAAAGVADSVDFDPKAKCFQGRRGAAVMQIGEPPWIPCVQGCCIASGDLIDVK